MSPKPKPLIRVEPPRGPCTLCGRKVPRHERPADGPMICGDCQRKTSWGRL